MTGHNISPEDCKAMVEGGQAVLIDVREEGEFAAEHIAGAHLIPASSFDPDEVLRVAGDKDIIFHCKMGPRADRAREYFTAMTGREAACMHGSITAWKEAGLPVQAG